MLADTNPELVIFSVNMFLKNVLILSNKDKSN